MSKNKDNGYKVLSHRYDYTDIPGFQYTITLNKSTDNTLRLWKGIEKGLDMYEKYEHSKGLKKWFIGWFMGFNKK